MHGTNILNLFREIDFVSLLQTKKKKKKKQHTSGKVTPRKRKIEMEMGSERRNPSRKARPRENFAVEEERELRPRRSPKTVDAMTLLKVLM